MSWRRTWRNYPDWYGWPWNSEHMGRWWKRRLAKAERALAKNHTRERSVVHIRSNVNWKNW